MHPLAPLSSALIRLVACTLILGHFDVTAIHRHVSHDLAVHFGIRWLKPRSWGCLVFSVEGTVQEDGLLHPMNRRHEYFPPDFQTRHAVVVWSNAVVVGKLELTFNDNSHPFHAEITTEVAS